ncbi:MAG TPA: hypothetical protein PKA82_06050 [Pyrinomonadaceae bacterium]|nr:hypothetical protein [Pyrinomonadaceae bacterium]
MKINTRSKRRLKNALLACGVLGILIPSTGCQAASDMFNPDTYSWDYNKEPWEKNIKRKNAPKKNVATDY